MLKLPDIKKPQSYKTGVNVSYKVREFDPTQHEIYHEGLTHDRYNCPHCLERRGKEDDDGKFYWDREKLIGYCFKCEVVGLLKSDKPISELQLHIALSALKTSLVKPVVDISTLNEIAYEHMFDPLDPEALEYCVGRVPVYTEELLTALQMRQSPKVGVTFPVRIDDKIIAYTLRYYNPTGKMKYFIPVGVKYLYSPNNILRAPNRNIEITLVEGPFDALGALLDGFPNPISLFGKTITPLQIALLRKYSPSKINIYLDEATLSWTLFHKIKRAFPTCSQIKVIYTYDDPEEVYQKKLGRLTTEADFACLLANLESTIKQLRE